jgi:cell division protein FtsA
MKGKDDINRLVAFDFAATGVRAIAARILEDGSIRVLSSEHRMADEIKHGIIGQPSGTAFNVTSLLKQLQNSAGFHEPITQIATAVGGKSMKIVHASVSRKLNKSKEITDDIIDDMALECEKSYQSNNMLVYDTIPVNYELDGKETENPEGHRAYNIVGHYHLVVGSELMKLQLQKCMERIYNCSVDYISLTAEALSYAVAEVEDRENGCAIIHMGDTYTTLSIYRHELLQYLLVVPFGGGNITKDIEEIGISQAHAEKLKHLQGIASQSFVENEVHIRIPTKNPNEEPLVVAKSFLAMIIESRLDEIFNPIFQQLQVYQHALPNGIIISGGAAKLTNIKEYLEMKTGLPVRIGDHSGWLSDDTPEEYDDLAYAQIIGTLILAHEHRLKSQEAVESEPPKKIKNKRKSFTEKITQGIFSFFEDDTELKDSNQK